MSTQVDELRRLTPQEFRDVIGHFASGVTVITAVHEGEPKGTTASAVTSLSLEPPMVLICLNKTSSTCQAVAGAGRFAVNILGEDQAEEAMRFASRKTPDKFKGVALISGQFGEPLLGDALAILECNVKEEVTGGTHSVFLAEVERASARAGTPLAYFRGQFGRLELEQDERAFKDLRARVLSRDLSIGVRFALDELAGSLGAPRGPVFHALAKLTGEGLIERHADGTYEVEPLTLEAVHEAQRARYAIELGVAALTVGKVSDERLAGLRAAMELTKPALYADGPRFEMDAYLPQYMAFHEAVVALADTPVLVDAYRRVNAPPMIINMTGGRLAESGGDREATETGYAHHRELVEAYERGDLEAVNATILTHIEFTLDITRRFMDAAGGTI